MIELRNLYPGYRLYKRVLTLRPGPVDYIAFYLVSYSFYSQPQLERLRYSLRCAKGGRCFNEG